MPDPSRLPNAPPPAPPPTIGTAFRWLLWSDALTLLALMVGQVALPWWIASCGGAHDLAIYGVATAAMSFVAMPLLSPLADRHAKRSLITAGLLLAALAAVVLAGVASTASYRLGVVIAIQVVGVLAGALITPATNSIATELVAPQALARALGRQQGAQATGRLIGPAIAGGVLAAAGTGAALWLNAALLLAAAAHATRLPRPAADAAAAAAEAPRRRWATEFRVGLRANWAIPIERGWVLVNFISAIFLMPAITMLVPLKVQSLGLSARWLGGCEAALSLGLLAGALWIAPLWVRVQGRFATRVTAAVVIGLALALAGLTTRPTVLVSMFCVVGLASAATTLVGKTHRMLARPLAFRARMSAGAVTTIQVAQTLGPALAGVALAHASVSRVYVSFGLLGAFASLGFTAVPGFRAFMALDHHEVENWYGRQYPHVFATEPKDG
jgi:MFS family permease